MTTPASFLALGDSYTVGEGIDAHDRWTEQLSESLRNSGVPVRPVKTIAHTGWTTSDLLNALEGTNGTFDMVSLLIGVNDHYQGRALTAFDGTYEACLRKALTLCNAGPSGVIALSIPDWGVTPFGRSSGQTEISAAIDGFNGRAAALCRKHGVPFVDITTPSREAASDPSLLATDALHYSAAMYARFADAVLPFARKVLSR